MITEETALPFTLIELIKQREVHCAKGTSFKGLNLNLHISKACSINNTSLHRNFKTNKYQRVILTFYGQYGHIPRPPSLLDGLCQVLGGCVGVLEAEVWVTAHTVVQLNVDLAPVNKDLTWHC